MDGPGRSISVLLSLVLLLAHPGEARADWPADPSHFVKLAPGGEGTALQDACGDGMGGAFVLWTVRNLQPVITSHLEHLDSFGRPRFVPGPWASVAGDGSASTHLASDGAGGAVMLLTRYVGPPNTVEVQLQRFGYAGAILWTTTLWTGPVPDFYDWNRVKFDPSGPGWVVSWIDPSGASDVVRAQYVDAGGATRWSDDLAITMPPGASTILGLTEPDGAGGCWLTSLDGVFGNAHADVQHLRADGTREWGPGGVSIAIPTNGMIEQIAGDASHVLWLALGRQELSDASDRIQRLRPDGTTTFGANGIVLPNSAAGDRTQAALGVIDANRVFVAWTHPVYAPGSTTELQAVDSSGVWQGTRQLLRTGTFGEYPGIRVYPLPDRGALVTLSPVEQAHHGVQRVNAAGEPLWPEFTTLMQVPGPMLDYYAASVAFVPPVPTGDGGIVMFEVMQDSVVTVEDPYPHYVRAQHLDAEGRLGVDPALAAPPLIAPRNALAPPEPSPMTTSTRVRFSLATDAEVDVALFDLSGRRLRTLANGRWPGGEHAVLLRRGEAGVPALRAGLYWLRLVVAGEVSSRSVVVLD